VVAVLLTAVPLTAAGVSSGPSVWSPAVWPGPGGVRVRGDVPARPGTDAGTSVGVWLDDTGHVVPAPLGRGDVVINAVVAGAVCFVLLANAALSGHLLICAALGRHRARQWARGWAEVEPRWAGRADR
jgi:hypothetical protein